MSWFSSWMHPERGYKSAQEQLDKYYQEGQGYLNPYNENGKEAYGSYSGAMQKLLNPGALEDEWSKGYTESDLAKQNEATASQSGLNAAQAMGLGGSTPALQVLQSGTAGIVAQDRQKFLDDLMQKYMAGIGIGQNIYNTGANTAEQMAQNAGNMGQNSAQMQFNKTNAQGDLFGKIVGTGAALGATAMGGPAARWGVSKAWNDPGTESGWKLIK